MARAKRDTSTAQRLDAAPRCDGPWSSTIDAAGAWGVTVTAAREWLLTRMQRGQVERRKRRLDGAHAARDEGKPKWDPSAWGSESDVRRQIAIAEAA